MLLMRSVHAQTPPNPDPDLQQRLIDERNREIQDRAEQATQRDVREPVSAKPVEAKRLTLNEKPCFTIRQINIVDANNQVPVADTSSHFDPHFELNKNKLSVQDQKLLNLYRIARDAVDFDETGAKNSPLNQCLGAAAVNTVIARAQNAVVAEGYTTTRILSRSQDLNAGVLSLTLIPGTIRQIISSADNSADNASRLSWRNALSLRSGDLLNLRDIEQGLENLKRVPTAEADIQITPAKDGAPGQSDLVIQYQQKFPLRTNLSFDDSGSTSTGKYQGNITVNLDNMLTVNDVFYVSTGRDIGGFISQSWHGKDPGARGTDNYAVHYSVPYGDWLFALNANKSNYSQHVAGAFNNYVYSGESKNQDFKVSKLLYRDAKRKTYLSVKAWAKQSKSFIDNTEIEVQRRRTAGYELGLNHKEFIGDASLDASVALRRGTGARDAIAAPESAFGEGESRPDIYIADVSYHNPFVINTGWGEQKMRNALTLRGQWTDSKLIPADRFSVGGRSTVRGYDGQMIIQAERGWVARYELSAQLGASGQEAYLAYDYGHVSGPEAEWLLTNRLQSAALGLRGSAGALGSFFKGLNYDIFMGWPIAKVSEFKTANKAYGFNVNWSF